MRWTLRRPRISQYAGPWPEPPGRRSPEGLCADRSEHPPHRHDSASLGRFWCTADQEQREPHRSQRLQDQRKKS
jgi:hypothetical protein